MDYYARLAKAQEAIESIRDTMEDPQEVQPLLVVGDMGEMELDALREQLEPAIEAETIKRDEWRAARKALEEELAARKAAETAEESEAAEKPELEPEPEPEPEWDFPVLADSHILYFRPHVQAIPGAAWHYLGKAPETQMAEIVGKVALIHNLASVSAVTLANREAAHQGIIQDVLIQVNVDNKPGHGINMDYMPTLLRLVSQSKNLRVRGFSCTASYNPTVAAKAYRALVDYRDSMREDWEKLDNVSLDYLSFGREDDMDVAIKAGSNFIRF